MFPATPFIDFARARSCLDFWVIYDPHIWGLDYSGRRVEAGIYIFTLCCLSSPTDLSRNRGSFKSTTFARPSAAHTHICWQTPLTLYTFDVTLNYLLESDNVSADTFLRLLPPKQFTNLSEAHRNSKQIFDQAKTFHQVKTYKSFPSSLAYRTLSADQST
jgi:hypothetical protein